LSTNPTTRRRKGVGLKAEVIETCLTVLSGILDDAVTDRRISANPLRDRLKLPTRIERMRKYLTHKQVRALAAEAKHPQIVLTLAYTGIRWVSWRVCGSGTWTCCAVVSTWSTTR
jgi:hypothetical protein